MVKLFRHEPVHQPDGITLDIDRAVGPHPIRRCPPNIVLDHPNFARRQRPASGGSDYRNSGTPRLVKSVSKKLFFSVMFRLLRARTVVFWNVRGWSTRTLPQ